MFLHQVDEVKQSGFRFAHAVGVLDEHCWRRGDLRKRRIGKPIAVNNARAGPPRPDRAEMALSGPGGSDQNEIGT